MRLLGALSLLLALLVAFSTKNIRAEEKTAASEQKANESAASSSQQSSSSSSGSSSSSSSSHSANEVTDAEQIHQEMSGSLTSSGSSSSGSSASGKKASNSSSSNTSTSTKIVQGKGGKKKVVKKTVVTEVEEEESSAEKREKAAREQEDMAVKFKAVNISAQQPSTVPVTYDFPESSQAMREREEKELAQRQLNAEAQRQQMIDMGSAFLDTKDDHINVRKKDDPFAACSDSLPADTCEVLAPLCAVSDTARAIRFLRERSDYILYLGKDIQQHIDFVKSTVPFNVHAPAILKNLDNIKTLLPSVTKTAPLLRLILDEDSEEELERILDAHLHFKQECGRQQATCKLTDIASAKREEACRIYDSQCCCDGLKFQKFYKSLAAADAKGECNKAKALRKSTRRLIEAACAHTCGSCPTRFRLKQYAKELVECERDRKVPLPKLADLHIQIQQPVLPLLPVHYEYSEPVDPLHAAAHLFDHQEILDHLDPHFLPIFTETEPSLAELVQHKNLLEMLQAHVPLKPAQLLPAHLHHGQQPSINMLAQILGQQAQQQPMLVDYQVEEEELKKKKK